MTNTWNKSVTEVTLLERLHHKRLASSTLVTEEITIPNSHSQSESNMDSTLNIDGQDMNLPLILSPSKSVEKTETEGRKLHPSSIRTTLRSKRKVVGEKLVSLEGVMNYPDKVIELSFPKCKRTTHGGESKSRGIPSSGGHSSSEEPTSEPTKTTYLHEYLTVTDPDLKHAEENAEAVVCAM
ncbi:unnamed protein product [Lactuca virosa]|uniref:Uncharacterized protein n=1 Tax=Lactuca virosa TaxID=75947 RepID=A0AAU9MJQ3_9ASTR|nr:unnamed protein product [Lactuca virosa]